MVASHKERGLNIAPIPGVKNGWFLNVRVWVNKQERRRREKFLGSFADAVVRYQEIKKSLIEGNRSSLTLSNTGKFIDLMIPYRDWLEENDKLSKSYKFFVDYVIRELGDCPLNDFPNYLEAWIKLKKEHLKRTRKKYKPHMVNRVLEICKAAYRHGIDDEKIDMETHPFHRKVFRKQKEAPRSLPKFDSFMQDRLLKVIDSEASHLSAVARFMLLVPSRKSELTQAVKEWLDLERFEIKVPPEFSKNDKEIVKTIPPALRFYFQNLPEDSEYLTDNFLFYRKLRNGKLTGLGDFKRAWNRCCKIAGIAGLRIHDTRHISATALVHSGNSERQIMKEAGWETPMLSTYYDENVDPIQTKFPVITGLESDTLLRKIG
jgi:integrase